MNNYSAVNEPLLDIRQVFWQQKRLILIVTAITTLITGFFIYTYTPTYEASVTIGTPRQPQASLIHTSAFSYLKPFQEQTFSTAESYKAFLHFLIDSSVTEAFHMVSSVPSLITVVPSYDYKNTRYIIKLKAKTPKQAVQQLNEYIAFLIRNVGPYWTVILENRQQIMINRLHLALAQLKQEVGAQHLYPYSSLAKLTAINNQTVQEVNFFAPQLTAQLIRRFQESTLWDNEQLIFIPEIKQNLFQFESPIRLSNAVIESKVQCTLLIGGLGGLILGFLLASLYCGNFKNQLKNKLL